MRKTIFLFGVAMCFVVNAEAQVSLNTSAITSFGYSSAKQSSYSVFFGAYAGQNVASSANNNSFFGHFAGIRNTNGSNNTFLGRSAGYYNTTGNANTAIGTMSLQNNATGSYNTCVGMYSGYNAKGGNNVFIGYQAGYSETASNKLYICNNSTSTPLVWGDFFEKRFAIHGKMSIGTKDMSINTSYLTVYGATNPSIVLSDGKSKLQLGVASGNNCYAIGGLMGDGVIRSLGETNNVIIAIANDDKSGKRYVGISWEWCLGKIYQRQDIACRWHNKGLANKCCYQCMG